jgi:hypothetical protein
MLMAVQGDKWSLPNLEVVDRTRMTCVFEEVRNPTERG